jgi:exopolyphosphatase/guanosine-5'-triphosphate,3'-diphosphate pyrophosphatase
MDGRATSAAPTLVTPGPPTGAAVDLGSTSVHLLVAEIAGHRLRPLIDESTFLGLGAAVDARAHLGAEAREELAQVLVRYATTAGDLGASTTTFMGTEPLRRAADSARIVDEVDRATRVPLQILSHEEEALLTVVGVTSGSPVEQETLVVDIGGGSSEFCVVAPGRNARAAGLRIGSNGLTMRFATSDPVSREAVEEMRAAADEILVDALPADPNDLIVVGGTATNLLKVTAAGAADPILSRARIAEALETLESEPAGASAARFGINPKRGPLLPAGAVIVEALMRRYEVDEVRVSEASLREGAILVADHAGRAWRDRLPELAHGWRR